MRVDGFALSVLGCVLQEESACDLFVVSVLQSSFMEFIVRGKKTLQTRAKFLGCSTVMILMELFKLQESDDSN